MINYPGGRCQDRSISFLGALELPPRSPGHHIAVMIAERPDRKRGCFGYRGYRGFFSPTSINPSVVNIENLDFKNPRFQTAVFSIFGCSQMRKLGCLKSEISKHSLSDQRTL